MSRLHRDATADGNNVVLVVGKTFISKAETADKASQARRPVPPTNSFSQDLQRPTHQSNLLTWGYLLTPLRDDSRRFPKMNCFGCDGQDRESAIPRCKSIRSSEHLSDFRCRTNRLSRLVSTRLETYVINGMPAVVQGHNEGQLDQEK